jgi:SAM-dependent methyltransferase
MTEKDVAQDYDRWLAGRSITSKLYSFYASLPGAVLVNTPAFRLPEIMQMTPGQRLLDIGCGRGALIQVFSSKVAFIKPPVGIDLSGEMLRLANRDLDKPSHPVVLMQASGLALPFADASFDVVVSSYVLKHLSDRDLLRFFEELQRVLAPAGVAVVWEFAPVESKKLNAFNEWWLRIGVRECNLRDLEQVRAFALGAGFEWAGNANLRPFLFPFIPRVSVLLGKGAQEFMHHDDQTP